MQTILHLSSEYPPQQVFGLGRYVRDLAEAQASLGNTVTVITNSLGGEEHETVVNGVFVKRVHFPPPPKAPTTSAMLLHFNLQLVERCLETIRQKIIPHFDVINSHDWLTVSAGVHLARLLDCPLVTTIHDVIFDKVRGRPFSSEDTYIAGIENWACQVSGRLVVLSQLVKQEIVRAYHADIGKIIVVPGGVSMPSLKDSEAQDIQIFRRKFCNDDQDLALFVGRLDAEKGVFTLIEAVVKLQRSWKGRFKLVVAGLGRLETQIREAIEKHGLASEVQLIGYLNTPDLRLAYASADFLIVPSEYEPFGLVSLEAQSLGTPVIVSNTGGLAETLSRTEGGIAFTPGNSRELSEAMALLLNDPNYRCTLGTKGKVAVERLYQWKAIARSLLAMYETIRSEPPPTHASTRPWIQPENVSPVNNELATVQALSNEHESAPLADIVIFWDTPRMGDLKPILQTLHGGHALKALYGKIHVIPVIQDTTKASPWQIPFSSPRIIYHHANTQDLIPKLLMRSAVIVAPQHLMLPLLGETPAKHPGVPIIWLGNGQPTPSIGIQVETLDLLYASVTKCLCDERFRAKLCPNRLKEIPQVAWNARARSRLKILHVLPQIVTGGAETTLLDIVIGTSSQYDHELLSLGATEGPLPKEFELLKVPIHHLERATISDILGCIESIAPNLLHQHSMSYIPKWIPVHRALSGARIFETEHVVNIGSGHFGPVDRVICVSQAVQMAHDRYIKIVGATGTVFKTIYNGIDIRAFQALPSPQQSKTALGLPLDRPVIGRVSALARNKLPEEALRIIPLVLQTVPRALFVIVGDGPQRKPAEDWVKNQGLSDSVLFLGERRDIPKVLRAFDVFAYYTNKDALGNVILEAVAAGVPVVTTSVEGTSEALGQAPGALVPLTDLHGFAGAIINFIQHPIGINNFHLPSQFHRDTMSKAYSACYKEAFGQPISSSLSVFSSGSKLLVKFPTRGRPDKFFEVLDRYYALASREVEIEYIISCDLDDASMNNSDIKDRLTKYSSLKIHYGNNKSKIEAVNADLGAHSDYTAILLASDDMIPVVHGYDKIIIDNLVKHFPDTDGVLFFNDGYRGSSLNTLAILGKAYFERFGYIYCPAYESLWADNEFMQVADALGRQVYIDQTIIRHEHPANTGAGQDALYTRNDLPLDKDRATFEYRRQLQFPSPKVLPANASIQSKNKLISLSTLTAPKCTVRIPITFMLTVYNEESRLPFVLEHSTKWADEIVVFCKISTDRTREILQQYQNCHPQLRIIDIPFSPQGSESAVEAITHASFDWVFVSTASEIPTRKLIETARAVIDQSHGKLDLIRVPRKIFSFGIHDQEAPWNISYYPFLVNRRKAHITDNIHNNFHPTNHSNTVSIPYTDECCVYHLTHPTAKAYLHAMSQYFESEASAEGDSRHRFSASLARAIPAARIVNMKNMDLQAFLSNMYLFEPIPDLYNQLSQELASDSRARVFPFALGDYTGQADFYLTNNEAASSSLLPFGKHRDLFPAVKVIDKIQVPVRNFEHIVSEYRLMVPDLVLMDVQGSEFSILSSMSHDFRSKIKAIYTEASTEEIYTGSKPLSEIIALLEPDFNFCGFHPLASFTPTHGNALFINSGFEKIN